MQGLIDALGAEIADFTIGFAIISDAGGSQDALPAGSGSLVTVGSVAGILTEAHVLRNLPDHGEVGLVRYPRVPPVAQRQTIEMAQDRKLIIGETDRSQGPDLGFLRLGPKDITSLMATNVFFNLEKRRDKVLSGELPGPPYFDGLSGMVAEWTTDLPSERQFGRVKGFRALYGVGLVVREYECGDFDLLDFEVTYGEGSKSPSSYEGMSGGALWRVYCDKGDNGQLSVAEKMVLGVAFYQSAISEEKRTITCHGPRSIYAHLIDAVHERWPA